MTKSIDIQTFVDNFGKCVEIAKLGVDINLTDDSRPVAVFVTYDRFQELNEQKTATGEEP